MSKKPQNQLQESKRAFKEMKADLQKVAAKMQNLDRKENYGLIKVAREQGELVDVVMSKPDRYGTNSVELLAAYLGRKADWLYKLKRLFRAFDDESMGILFQQGREKNAKPLTLSHLILLGAITGKPMPFIMSLAKKASMQHWTVADLRSAIAKTKSTKAPNQISIPAGLVKMLKTYQSANAQIDDWVGFVFEAIENSPPTDLTDTIANDLKDVQEQLEIFDRNSAMLADRVAVALRRCDNVRIETEKRQREKELETVANWTEINSRE